jgi:hypothetical protein
VAPAAMDRGSGRLGQDYSSYGFRNFGIFQTRPGSDLPHGKRGFAAIVMREHEEFCRRYYRTSVYDIVAEDGSWVMMKELQFLILAGDDCWNAP